MKFVEALEAMKDGKRVRRPDWRVGTTLVLLFVEDDLRPFYWHRDGTIGQPPYVSWKDALAADWEIAE